MDAFDRDINLSMALTHYNNGVKAYEERQDPIALYHFKRSYVLGFKGPEVQEGIKKVSERLITPHYPEELSLKIIRWSQFITFDQIILSISFITFFFFFALFKKKWMYHLILFSSTFFILMSLLYLKHSLKNYKEAIVLLPAEVYEGPSRVFPTNHFLPPGMEVIIDTRYEGWPHIAYPEPLSGWVWHEKVAYY